MFPLLINTPYFSLPTFFTMVMVGILLCTYYLYRRAPHFGFSQVVMLDLGMVGAVTGILGAKLYHVFFEYKYHSYYLEDPWRILNATGFVSYGAYIGGLFGIYVYLKIRRQSILQIMDFVATAIPILVIFIRLGCIGAGCCWGKPTDFFIHFIYPVEYPLEGRPSGVPLHATQLYDLLSGIFWFGILNFLYPRKKFHGQIVLLLFMGYSLVRFFIEFLRADDDRGFWLGGMLSSAQVTGLIAIFVSAVLYAVFRRKYPVK